MARSARKIELINRSNPILVINEHDQSINISVYSNLRAFGLVSRVIEVDDFLSSIVSSKFSMVVYLIESIKVLPYIPVIDTDTGIPIKKLVIDTNPSSSYGNRKWDDDTHYVICSRENIVHFIREYYHEHIKDDLFSKRKAPDDYSPKLYDLLDRLDIATDAISDLRINSASEIVAELRDINSSLKVKFGSVSERKVVSKNDLRSTVREILTIVAKIYDHIDNSRLAAIVVSGATTAIMGCSGLTQAVSLAIMLASWHGKDTFIQAINKITLSKDD